MSMCQCKCVEATPIPVCDAIPQHLLKKSFIVIGVSINMYIYRYINT